MANIILPQVDILSEVNDNTNILIEQDGNINRINANIFSQEDDYATEEYVKNKIAEAQLAGKDVDLSGYAWKSEIPIYTNQLINNSNFPSREELPIISQNVGNDETVVMSQAAITAALENITTLPYGGSKDWLDSNGDITQLYQIDGYIWAYIDSTGWTRTAQQYIIVSDESEMTNNGGIEYLLKNGNEGIVYSYQEATGDVGVPIVEKFPEVADDGDIVALRPAVVNSIEEMVDTSKIYDMNGTAWKHGEKITYIPATNKFVPSTATLNARLSGSSATVTPSSDYNGCFVTDFIPISNMDTETIFQVLLNWEIEASGDNKVVLFDSSKTRVGNAVISNSGTHLHYIQNNNTTTFDLKSITTISDWAQIAYARFQFYVHAGTELTIDEIADLTITMTSESKEVVSEEWINTELLTNRRYQAKNRTEEQLFYTNQIPISIDASNNIVGLTKGYRYNSSDVLTEATGISCTGFIPVKAGDIIRFKNLNFGSTEDGNIYIRFYDSVFGILSNPAITPYSINQDITTSLEQICSSYTFTSEGNISEITLNGSYNFNYMRLSFFDQEAEPIITVNEEIIEGTEIVSFIEWTNIGVYIEPTEASWNSTNIKYNIIDSLSSPGNDGNSAIYSVDGYLYTYILGATWMQTSKYSTPTLLIDGELSDSSTNAIQNRVVTSIINSIENNINKNSSNIQAINQRIAEIETGNNSINIPSFWQNAVDECVAKIKALQIGKNCVTFPFFSDNHQRNGYAGILISHIMKECHIPYCFYGGDSISSGYIDSEETMIAQDKAFDTIMSYVPNGRFCRAVGNHDGYWAVSASEKYTYSREQVYELFLREESVAQNKYFGDDGTYYYVEDISSKTRFIVLNTNGGNVNTTQINWLQNTALYFTEPSWTVVFISHQPISNHYHAGISNASQIRTIILNYINSTDTNKADIVGWYSGHIHRDRIYSGAAVNTSDDSEGVDMGFKQITITSDHTSIAYDDATKHTVANDDQSHAIDFVTINKNTKTVNLTRLGIGNDRSYTYT